MFSERHAGEDDGEDHLDEDESEFDPETQGQDAVLSVVDSQSLVFGAQEDGGDDVPADK